MGFFYIRVLLVFHWGHSSRKYVSSKTRESYLVPPPTTLIGALSYGYARVRGLPEESGSVSTAELIRENTLSVNARVLSPLFHYADLTRVWWFRERESMAKTDAVAVGKTYTGVKDGGSVDLEVVYIFRKDLKLEKRHLLEAAYSIIRVGGSRGLVSVVEVDYGEASELNVGAARTGFSTWSDLVDLGGIGLPLLRELVVDYRRVKVGDYTNAPLREHVYMYRTDTLKPVEVEVVLKAGALPLLVGDEVVVVEP
jgi:CRISPR-associated protein Cas5a/b/c